MYVDYGHFPLTIHQPRVPIVAVGLFKVVVRNERQREQNVHEARALVLQMGDMMGALLVSHSQSAPNVTLKVETLVNQQLHFVKHPGDGGGEPELGSIQTLLKGVEEDIVEFGNLIDCYCESSSVYKFLRAYDYGEQFRSAGGRLVVSLSDVVVIVG